MAARGFVALTGCVLLAACGIDVAGGANPDGGGAPSGGTAGTAALGGGGAWGGSSGSAATGGSGGTAATGGSGASGGTGGVAGGAAGSGGGGGTTVHNPAWWDPAWKNRYPITITNASGANAPKDLQVVLQADTQSLDKATSPYAGWRIVEWDGKAWTERTRVIDDAGGKQWIWFRLTAPVNANKTDTSYWLYTTNAGAPNPPYAADVWDYAKRFDTQDPSAWASLNPQDMVWDGSTVLLDGNGIGSSLRSLKTYGPGVGLDFALTVVNPLASANQWFCGGFQRTADFIDQLPWILWISRSPAPIVPEFNDGATNWAGTGFAINFGVEHVYGIDRYQRKHVFRYDNSPTEQKTWNYDDNTPHQIRFTAYNGSKIKLSWVRVRKAFDPPPTLTLGAAETY